MFPLFFAILKFCSTEHLFIFHFSCRATITQDKKKRPIFPLFSVLCEMPDFLNGTFIVYVDRRMHAHFLSLLVSGWQGHALRVYTQ